MKRIVYVFALAMGLGLMSCTPKSLLIVGQQTDKQLTTEITKTVSIDYLLYLPDDYNTSKEKWPLMLFLHGSGERGNDLEKVKVHGPPKLIANGKKFPFIIVSPQCPEHKWWESDALDALIKNISDHYRIDTDRIYVTGLSMGGFGTWDLALKFPDRFAAIAPICGGVDSAYAPLLKNLPIWAFHGAKDNVVPISQEQEMIDALKKIGGNVRFTVYPEAGHDAWTQTYDNPELYKWFLEHKR